MRRRRPAVLPLLSNNAMKLAFHLHAVRQHFRGPLPDADELATVLDWIAGAGFDGVDVSDSWGFAAVDAGVARATGRLARERGLAVATVSCMGKTLCHPELGEENCRALERALDVAAWMDCSLVNVALSIPRTPGVTPMIGARQSPGGSRAATDSDFTLTAERLGHVARLAQPRGIALCVELHDRGLADTSASLLRILDDVNESNVGANPDLTNGYRAYDVPPESWQDALRALAPRANLWHVNNMQRVHFGEIGRAAFVERPLPAGDIDYRLAVAMMRSAGFDGWVVVEYKGTGDAFECIAEGRDYLARILASGAAKVGGAQRQPIGFATS